MKLSAVTLAGMILYAVFNLMLAKETMEREFPAPPEWPWKLRWLFAKGAADQVPGDEGQIIDWANIGSLYENILKILEDREQEGKGIRPPLGDGGDIWVEGVGKTGLDLSEKSEPWRRGYHACLMGVAKAAEQMDGVLYDAATRIACPAEFVVGPSNPNPKPWPVVNGKPPLEENCKDLLPGPEVFYIKIITSQGFTSHQRIEAALAYGDWLEFKGLSSTAKDVYEWALDIATGALPIGVNDVVDMKTGIISGQATYVSSNILATTAALATHHARKENLAVALPIFLSILRARRRLPEAAPSVKPAKEQHSGLMLLYIATKDWLTVPPYPPPPPTGDDMPERTPIEICEEAAVMSSIGEILFASSSLKSSPKSSPEPVLGPPIPTASTPSQLEQFQSGLSWTRDAVDLAEETMIATGFSKEEEKTRTKCTQCLQAGVENWSTMVERMLLDERAAKEALKNEIAKASYSFWGVTNEGKENRSRWEGEARVVNTRIRRVKSLITRDQERQRPLWMRILGKQRDY